MQEVILRKFKVKLSMNYKLDACIQYNTGVVTHFLFKVLIFREPLQNLPLTFYCKYVHCRKKIGDLLNVSQQILIICSSLGIKIAQFVEH